MHEMRESIMGELDQESNLTLEQTGSKELPAPKSNLPQTRRSERVELVMIGGTGLVGEACLRLLAAGASEGAFPQKSIHNDSARQYNILCLGRHPPKVQSPIIQSIVGPSEAWESQLRGFSVTSALCCLGTTRKKAGTPAEFRRIDYEIPLAFAKASLRQGARYFHLVSSVGASAESTNLYLQTKGQLERDLASLSFEGLFIYRPSLLLGTRSELRLGEFLAQKLSYGLSPLLKALPWTKKYAPIHAYTLARFILQKIKMPEKHGRVLVFEAFDHEPI